MPHVKRQKIQKKLRFTITAFLLIAGFFVVANFAKAAVGFQTGTSTLILNSGENLMYGNINAASNAGSNLLLLQNASLSKFLITSSGNVGIGASSINDIFSIGNGTTAAPSGSSNTGHNFTSTYLTTDDYALTNYGVVKSLIGSATGTILSLWGGTLNGNIWNGTNGAGNVGIGTTTPNEKLTIQTAAVSGEQTALSLRHSLTAAGDSVAIKFWPAGAYSGMTLPGKIVATAPSGNNIGFNFVTNNSGTANTAVSILPDGKVGIGTTNPGAKLDINASDNSSFGLKIQSPSTNNYGSSISFSSNIGAGTKSGLFQLDTSGNMVFRAISGGGLYFDADSTGIIHFRTTDLRSERMTILNNGNVGIGTSTPIEKLDIGGAVRSYFGNTGVKFYALGTSPTYPRAVFSIGTNASDVNTALIIQPEFGTNAVPKPTSISIGTVKDAGASDTNNRLIGIYQSSTYGSIYTLSIIGNTAGTPLKFSTQTYLGNNSGLVINNDTNSTVTIGSDTLGTSQLNVIPRASLNAAYFGGNVGIGTTAPNDVFSIGNAGTAPSGSSNTGHNFTSTYLSTDDYALANYGLVKTMINSATSTVASTSLWLGTKNGNIWNGDSGAGNVGIGLTAPTKKVDIAGNLSFTSLPDISTATLDAINKTETVGGGTLVAGTYHYSVVYTLTDGTETGYTGTMTNGITVGANAAVVLDNLPISTDSRVNGRKIFRSTVNGGRYFNYLIATIANNTATTYNDTGAAPNMASGYYHKPNTTAGFIYLNNVLAMRIGPYATAFGAGALQNQINASYNSVAIGDGAMRQTTTGDGTAVGSGALNNNTTGAGNAAFGYSALSNNVTGGGNSAFGFSAVRSDLYNTYNYNSGFGYNALGLIYNNSQYNTAIGAYAGYSTYTAASSYNTFLGARNAAQLLTNGSYNILIGYNADVPATTTSNFLNIGQVIYATGLGTGGSNPSATGNIGIGTFTPNDNFSIGNGGNSAPAGSSNTGHNFTSTYLSTDDYALANYGIVKTLIGSATGTILSLWGGTLNGNIWNGSNGTGNVGIGTTTPTNKLFIEGDLKVYNNTVLGGSTVIGGLNENAILVSGINYGGLSIDSVNGSYVNFKASGATKWNFGNVASDNSFRIASSTFANAYFTINNSGNVGIATTNPDYKLTVNGSVRIAGGTSSNLILDNGTSLQGKTTSGSIYSLMSPWTDNNVYLGAGSGFNDFIIRTGTGNINFNTTGAGTTRLAILNGGNVGIGTTAPNDIFSIGNTGTAPAGSSNTGHNFTSTYLSTDDYALTNVGYVNSLIAAATSTIATSTAVTSIFVTATTSAGTLAYTGGYVGYDAGNKICNSVQTGSHFCRTDEIVYLIQLNGSASFSSINGQDAWIADGPPGYTGAVSADDCGGWVDSTNNKLGHFWIFASSGGGRGSLSSCDTIKKITCCK